MAEIAQGFVTLIPSFKGGQKAIQKELDGAADGAGKSAGTKAGKGFGGTFVGGLKGVGGALTAAFAAPVIIGGLNSLADKASDLNETINKSTVIFGKNAGEIDKWAKGAATSLGLSRQQALDAASGFGDMFSQIGFSGDQATKMSKSVVQMSADLGSFNNLETSDVADRMSAAFRGEYDSLQALIPNINAARVESQAMAMTGKKTAKELTAQEKAAATLAIVQKDGARAMGDFARTSDGAANKAKIQAARFEDLKTRAGGVLLPIKSLAIDGFGALITGAERLAPTFSRIGAAFKGLFDLFAKGDFTGGLGRALGIEEDSATVDTLFRIRDAVITALGQAKTFIQTQVVPAFNGIVSSVKAFVAVALPIAQQFVAGMQARIGPLMPQIRGVFTTIGQIIVGVMGLIQAIIQRVTTIIGAVWSRWGSNIMDFAAKIFKAILNIISGALKIISGIVKTVTALIKGDWSGAWNGIKQIVSGALQVIKGTISGAMTIIKGVFSAAWLGIRNAASAAWGAIRSAVSTGIGRVVDHIRSLPGRAVSALGELGGLLFGAGSRLIQGLIDGIASKIQAVKDKVASVAGAIKDFFPGSPVKEGPLRSWNNGGAGKRLGDMLADGLTASRSTVAAASSRMAGAVAVDGVGVAGVGGGSQAATIQALTAALERATLRPVVTAGQFDRAMGAVLR